LAQTRNTRTENAKFMAVKRWVKYTLWPRVKIELEQIGAALGQFAFQTTVSVAVNHMLDQMKGSPIGPPEDYAKTHPYRASFQKFAGRFEYNPSQFASAVPIGAGSLSYKFKNSGQKAATLDMLREHALNLYQEKARDHGITSVGKEFFEVSITVGDQVMVSLNKQKIDQYCEMTPDACGYFATNPNWVSRATNYLPIIRRELQTFYDEMKKAGMA
jgi:hypothetical protein